MEFLGSFFRVDLAGDAMDGVTLRADLAVDLVRRLDLARGPEPCPSCCRAGDSAFTRARPALA